MQPFFAIGLKACNKAVMGLTVGLIVGLSSAHAVAMTWGARPASRICRTNSGMGATR